MSKKLEHKIAAALTDDVSSSAVAAVIAEVETALAAAKKNAELVRARAFDPKVIDASARSAVDDANYPVQRLQAALSELNARFTQVQSDEDATRWSTDYEAVKLRRDAAAKRFAEYPKLAAKLIALLQEAEAVDAEISDLHGSAPAGESRRLLSVELTARDLLAFSREQPSIAKTMQLPDWELSCKLIWPVPTVPMSVRFAAPSTYTYGTPTASAPTDSTGAETVALRHGRLVA